MKINKLLSLAGLLKIVLTGLIVIWITLFFYITYYIFSSNFIEGYKKQIIILYVFFLIGYTSLGNIIYRFIYISNSLIKNNPFTYDNVKSLKLISFSCFCVTMSYVFNFIFNPMYGKLEILIIDGKGVHTDIEYLIFLFAGCFIFILAKVFEKAVIYKEENELTI